MGSSIGDSDSDSASTSVCVAVTVVSSDAPSVLRTANLSGFVAGNDVMETEKGLLLLLQLLGAADAQCRRRGEM